MLLSNNVSCSATVVPVAHDRKTEIVHFEHASRNGICLTNQPDKLNESMIKKCREMLRSLNGAKSLPLDTSEVRDGIVLRIKLMLLFGLQKGDAEDCLCILKLIELIESNDMMPNDDCELLLDALNVICTDQQNKESKTVGATSEFMSILDKLSYSMRARCERLLPSSISRLFQPKLLIWVKSDNLKSPSCQVECNGNCLQEKLFHATNTSSRYERYIGCEQSFRQLQPSWKDHDAAQQNRLDHKKQKPNSDGEPLNWKWFNASLLERRKDEYQDRIQLSRSERSSERKTKKRKSELTEE